MSLTSDFAGVGRHSDRVTFISFFAHLREGASPLKGSSCIRLAFDNEALNCTHGNIHDLPFLVDDCLGSVDFHIFTFLFTDDNITFSRREIRGMKFQEKCIQLYNAQHNFNFGRKPWILTIFLASAQVKHP
jgi:hypothetical protein